MSEAPDGACGCTQAVQFGIPLTKELEERCCKLR